MTAERIVWINVILTILCLLTGVYNAYRNLSAGEPAEPPAVMEPCFDNTDRYYIREEYR